MAHERQRVRGKYFNKSPQKRQNQDELFAFTQLTSHSRAVLKHTQNRQQEKQELLLEK